MQIAPVATAYTEASTTATTPTTTPTNTTGEDIAEIDLGGGRHGWQTNRAVRRLITGAPR